MFDLTTAREIAYGPGGELSVRVFRDRTEKNIWYMEPAPRLRIQNSQPVFSLTRYLSNDSEVAGVLTFDVELHAPQDAKLAAEREIPEIEAWGDFTWVSGDAFFDQTFPGPGGVMVPLVTQTPSLFGSNVASFQVAVATPEEVATFVAAFTTPGGVSPCRVEYQMGVLTQLLAAEARVVYKADVAIDYERTYATKKDTWGNRKSVLVGVKQTLKESGAGDVRVTPGAGVSDEIKQMVTDWAWTTLENQVAAAVDAARALAQGNQSPVSVTSDFTRTYSEDAIVEWSTPVSANLPRFDDATWPRLYREVDNRELVVTFALAGDLYGPDDVDLFEYVTVEVRYPTRTTDNTFQLIPGDDDAVSKTYVAPGGGTFDPNYEYRYTVQFGGGTPAYESAWISETATLVVLRPSDFGIRNVTFLGQNVPFGTTVEKVLIDFFEVPPGDLPSKMQVKEMTANGEAGQVSFSSAYHVPITNIYNYRLRYLLKTGTTVVYQPGQQFGSANADLVMVLDPAPSLANMAVRGLVSAKKKGFLDVSLHASYYDVQNSAHELTHRWTGWNPPRKVGIQSAETWYFDAQPDPETAYFDLSGQIVYGEGMLLLPVNGLKLPYKNGPLFLSDTEELLSVEIFSDAIDWEAVTLVTLNLFQAVDEAGEIAAGEAPKTGFALAELDDPEVAAGFTQPIAYSVLKPADGVKRLPSFYTLRRPISSEKIVFYYNGDYVLATGGAVAVDETAVTGKLQLHLPPLPPAGGGRGIVHRVEIPVASL
ncbi:MAG TPA: hypothetical protein VHW26_11745 [Solirubrobacteraceae bacterium]|jgi:hypothetical protein|nr:hypothetical protein [Solirubrobacteraceae bacterium]